MSKRRTVNHYIVTEGIFPARVCVDAALRAAAPEPRLDIVIFDKEKLGTTIPGSFGECAVPAKVTAVIGHVYRHGEAPTANEVI
jgi:hypothetical protein